MEGHSTARYKGRAKIMASQRGRERGEWWQGVPSNLHRGAEEQSDVLRRAEGPATSRTKNRHG